MDLSEGEAAGIGVDYRVEEGAVVCRITVCFAATNFCMHRGIASFKETSFPTSSFPTSWPVCLVAWIDRARELLRDLV